MVILDAYKTGRCFCYFKIFILVFGCYLPVYSTYYLKCNFTNFCHPHGSYWWRHHANNCYQYLSDKIYHCARDYDDPDVFKEGCAVEKICPAGEEPHLSFFKSGSRRKELKEPIVHCRICHDDNYFNDRNRSSSTYSQCPDEKKNDCSRDKHKILCKIENSKEERYCRCDARKGYWPVNDKSHEACSYKNYDCRNYECHEAVNGQPQQRMLNYTCAPYCQIGYDRLREDSDICEPVPPSSAHFTTQPATIVTLPNSSVTTTETTSTSNSAKLSKYLVGSAITLAILLIFTIIFIFKRRCKRKRQPNASRPTDITQDPIALEQMEPMIDSGRDAHESHSHADDTQDTDQDPIALEQVEPMNQRGRDAHESQSHADGIPDIDQATRDLDRTKTILEQITIDEQRDFVITVIQKQYVYLRDHLNAIPLLDILYQRGTIDIYLKETIESKNSRPECNKELMKSIKGIEFYKSFIMALSYSKQRDCLDGLHEQECVVLNSLVCGRGRQNLGGESDEDETD